LRMKEVLPDGFLTVNFGAFNECAIFGIWAVIRSEMRPGGSQPGVNALCVK
jgi:hypothetical protein